MNFNIHSRSAFVDSIMNDVPRIDFNERVRKLVNADMIAHATPKLAKALSDPELIPYLITGSRSWITDAVKLDNQYYYGYEVGVNGVPVHADFIGSPALKVAVGEIMLEAIAQHLKLGNIRSQLRALAGACKTHKQAIERMPEFSKYLPPEPEKCTTLPAVANVAAELIKAGWPKDIFVAAAASKKDMVDAIDAADSTWYAEWCERDGTFEELSAKYANLKS